MIKKNESKLYLYNKSIEDIINKYSYPWVHSIYQYGAINNPGISDLDMLIIEDTSFDTSSFWSKIPDTKSVLNRDTQMVMGHASLMFAPLSTLKNLNIQDQLSLKLKHGKKIEIIQHTDKKESFITLLRLLDWVPERLLLNRKMLSNDISLIESRFLLGFLKSVCFSINQFKSLTHNSSQENKEFDKKICDLRLNLESKKIYLSEKQKVSLLEESKICLESLLINLDEHINFQINLSQFGILSNEFLMKIPSRGHILFSDEISFSSEDYIKLPIKYGIQWYYYYANGLNINGFFERYQTSSYKKDLNHINNNFLEILSLRLEIVKIWLEYKADRFLKPNILKMGFVKI